ncbi:MAG: Uma2 family endonuclease, partial [Tepidiformaceae bacterium]
QGFLDLPESKPGLEFFRGRVTQKPVTNADHIKIVWRLSAAFHAYAATHGGRGGPEGSVALDGGGPEPEVLLPDFAFWAEGTEMGTYPLSTPTVAVEVRSPSQTIASQRAKCGFYVEHGVAEAWLFDPVTNRVELFGADGRREEYDADDTLTSVALPGLAVDLGEIFDAAG